MKIYCGTDIIEVDRIKQAILSTNGFKEKAFTGAEISYAETKCDTAKYQTYAGRFAAKEAIYKSLSKVDSSLALLDIEILNDKSLHNRPYCILHNTHLQKLQDEGKLSIDVSISHVQETAIAHAISTFEG